MNGISAVGLATGNDTRALEAGAHYIDLADDPGSMVERIDLVFFGGEMDAETDTLLTDAVAASMNNSNDANLAAQVGLFLALTSPSQAVSGGAL